ncbi:MAG: hypothetical protein V2I62_14555 [Bacteroidales bacterium]|nr:hypothetical protein [Bacteroidales bacterium]
MNRQFTFIVIFIITMILSSCNMTKKATETSQVSEQGADKISLYAPPLDSLATDHFNIDSIAMKDQTLFVYVTYGGGCGDADFEMFYKPQVMAVMPHRNALYLKLTDHDPCRELIQKKLVYDLSFFNKEAKSGGVIFSLDKYEFMYTMSEN